MAKIYPFKYRFENKGIQPLHDSVWFESHQELLLRIVNTPQGRDLLCIDKSFDGIQIIGFAKNRVTGFLGFDGENARLVSDFRVGAKWANVIRYRWREFQSLAREHYSDKVNKQTEILLNGDYRMAATTSTFYPNADGDPSPTTVDGRVAQELAPGFGVDWSTIVAASGNSGVDTDAGAICMRIIGDSVSNKFRGLTRSIFLFDMSAISSDVITSAVKSIVGYGKGDGLSAAPDINIYTSAPASDTGLVGSDYASLGSIALSSAISHASYNTSGRNEFDLNPTGITELNDALDLDGIARLGIRNANYDVADSAPPWASLGNSYVQCRYADNAGVEEDPKLVVVHSTAGIAILRRRMEGY